MDVEEFNDKLSKEFQGILKLAENGAILTFPKIEARVGDILLTLAWDGCRQIIGEIKWANMSYSAEDDALFEGRIIKQRPEREEAVEIFLRNFGPYVLRTLQWHFTEKEAQGGKIGILYLLTLRAVTEIARVVCKPIHFYRINLEVLRKS